MSRRNLLGVLAGIALASMIGGGVVLLKRHGSLAPVGGGTTTTLPAVETAIVDPPEPALIDVAVATLWAGPDKPRPIDEPALANPVDIKRWIAGMNDASKKGLIDRVVTQVLYGERVSVVERRGSWSRIVVPSQPSTLDPRGYPGWLPSAQLAGDDGPSTRPRAVVVKAATALREVDNRDKTIMELSYNTTLPVMAVGGPWVTVARPHDGQGLVAAADVQLIGRNRRPPSGADLVQAAQAFSGLPYLWGGTSSNGFDCSGLTYSIFGAHGISIPRDADEQAAAGTPVDRSGLAPGDLLFFAEDDGKGAIHHVAMYVGNNQMIQSPATGRTVETVAVDSPPYAKEFWGARRYLPPSSQ